jgi:hypothetical protein
LTLPDSGAQQLQVLSGAQVEPVFEPCPQSRRHAVPDPQATLHVVAPEQATVQPPSGQVTSHPLLPWQVTVPPVPTETLHVLVPSQVMVLSSPAVREHELPPAHVYVQFDSHFPEHCDWPAQFELHPVPQLTLHVFFDAQLKVALLGPPVSDDPLSAPEPKEHVAPELHVQVVPVHAQEPLHSRGEGDAPAHEAKRTTTVASSTTRANMPERQHLLCQHGPGRFCGERGRIVCGN